MCMEFLILQGNTQSINTINYKIACTTMERRSVQDEITQVTELMQDYEDNVDYAVQEDKKAAKANLDFNLASLKEALTPYKEARDTAKKTFTTATTTLSAKQASFDSAKLAFERLDKIYKDNGNEFSIQCSENAYNKAKLAYEIAEKELNEAQQAKDAAATAYNNTVNIYNTESEDYSNQTKILNQNYTLELDEIEANKKSLKEQATKAQKENLANLNKRDARLELTLNELNDMKEMLKSEKDAAKQSAEQKAQDLAPKYG